MLFAGTWSWPRTCKKDKFSKIETEPDDFTRQDQFWTFGSLKEYTGKWEIGQTDTRI